MDICRFFLCSRQRLLCNTAQQSVQCAVRVETVNTCSRRVCCVRMCSDTWRLLLINVYMPYEHDDESTDEFLSLLSVIEHLINEHADCLPILGGDFNVDFPRSRTYTDVLNEFCERVNIIPTVRHASSQIDYTYNFNMTRFNTLDHFITAEYLFETAVSSVVVCHDGDNLSDHDPVTLTLCLQSAFMMMSEKIYSKRAAWYKANEGHLNDYKLRLQYALRNIVVPVDALVCRDTLCHNVSHSHMLNLYAKSISNACTFAASESIPHTGTGSHGEGHRVPGWTEFVEPAREKSMLWHHIWLECGRPRSGMLADIMRKTRAAYHYAIRRVKRDKQTLVRQRFADALLSDNSRDLWSEVKKISGKRAIPARVVDGHATAESISEFFAHKYQELYNSVPYDSQDLDIKRRIIEDRVASEGYTSDCTVTADEIISATKRLKPNKQDGNASLSTNHFRFAGCELHIHTVCLFSGMLVHGSVPDDFLFSTAVPVPKGRNVNLTDSSNYRGIALSSIFGKLFDLVVLSRYSEYLESCELQVGFKPKRSTAMCSMILNETISYYVNSNSQVNCVFLDATKAFDRIEYGKLFQLLLDRNLPPQVIRVMLNMYTNQEVCVLWNGNYSQNFSVVNGVKQGAIISPILFCVYLDNLLIELREAGVGCFIGSWFVGALAYADDLVLLAPTASAMRRMLFIDGKLIENVSRWPHLGHVLLHKALIVATLLPEKIVLLGRLIICCVILHSLIQMLNISCLILSVLASTALNCGTWILLNFKVYVWLGGKVCAGYGIYHWSLPVT